MHAAGVLALLMLTTVAATQAPTVGQISATAVRMADGAQVEARLKAIYRYDESAARPSSHGTSFALDAKGLRVDTYQYDPAVFVGGVSATPPMPGYEPETHAYARAHLETITTRSGYQFSVVAATETTIAMATSCASLGAPDRQEYEVRWLVAPPAQPVRADVSDSVQWKQCGTGEVTVTGDFIIVLYEIDAILTTASESVEVRSGDDRSDVVPGSPSGPVYAAHRRQQYLYVNDGTLTFPMDDSPHLVFLASPSVEPHGAVEFQDARGQLGSSTGPQSVDAGVLRLEGALQFTAVLRDGRLQSSLTGTIDSARADGHPMSLAASPAPRHALLAWWPLGLVGIVAVPASLLIPRQVRRARASQVEAALERSRALFSSLHFEGARAWAAKAIDLAPNNAEAHYRLGQALAQLGQIEGCLHHHARADDLLEATGEDPELLAETLYGSAEWAAYNGDAPMARKWLRQALQAKPGLRSEAEESPFLHAILRQVDATGVPPELQDLLRP